MNVRLPFRRPSGYQKPGVAKLYADSLRDFADDLISIQKDLDFHVSARGWCYEMEHFSEPPLDKGDFDWAQDQINEARKRGFLKPGFILEEEGHEIERQDEYPETPEEYAERRFEQWQEAKTNYLMSWRHYDADDVSFWDDKDCYIQLLVEKVDLKSLFRNICEKYRIPMANMKGMGSIEQKAGMAQRFREMENKGKVPVLLACGDHDPAGLCISNILKDHFLDYGAFSGWNAENLIVDRIGLNYDFIQENGLSWISGLKTASGKDLANPNHYFYKKNIYDIQGYIEKYGTRKCEANAVIVVPELGRKMLTDAIAKYIGEEAYEKYESRIKEGKEKVRDLIAAKMEYED